MNEATTPAGEAQCEVRYYVGHGAPGTPAERIERCPGAAVTTLTGVHLSRPCGMPEVFQACGHHSTVMRARARAGLTGGAMLAARPDPIKLDMTIREALRAGWSIVPIRRRHAEILEDHLQDVCGDTNRAADVRNALRNFSIMAMHPEVYDADLESERQEQEAEIYAEDAQVRHAEMADLNDDPRGA